MIFKSGTTTFLEMFLSIEGRVHTLIFTMSDLSHCFYIIRIFLAERLIKNESAAEQSVVKELVKN